MTTGGLARPIVGVVVALSDQAADADGLWPADFDLLTRIEGLERLDAVATEAVLAAGFHERLLDYLPGVDEERPPPSAAAAPSIAAPGGSGQLHFSRRDREDELLEVARALQSGGAGPDAGEAPAAAGNAAVVFQRPLPYLYLARQLFPQAGVPMQTRDSFPLAAEPYAAALDLVLEFVRSGCERTATIALLRSPHFRFEHAGRRPVAGEIDALDRLLQRHGFGRGRQELAALAARCAAAAGEGGSGDSPESEAAPAAAVAAALAEELRQLAAPGSPAAHLELLAAFLRRHAVAEAPPTPRETRARDAVLEGLSDLTRAHREIDDTPVGLDELAASIRRWIESRTFRPQTGSAGVHLVDARAAIYGRFETVFIVGLVDDEWPPPPQRVVFYPQPLLRTLGWPAERDRLQAARARFGDLLRLAAERVSVSAFALEDDMVVIPSMLLEQLAEAGLAVAREAPAPAEPSCRTTRCCARRRRQTCPTRRASGSRCARGAGTTTATAARRGRAAAMHTRRARSNSTSRARSSTSPATSSAWRRSRAARPRSRPSRGAQSCGASRRGSGPPGRRTASAPSRPPTSIGRSIASRRWWTPRCARRPRPSARCCAPGCAVRRRLPGWRSSCAGWSSRAQPTSWSAWWTCGSRTPARCPAGETSRQVGVRGALDRVDLFSDGTFDVIDYKAGRVPPADRTLRLAAHARWAERRLAGYRGRQWRLRDAAYVALNDPRLRVPLGGASVDAALAQGETQAAAVLEQIGRGAYPVQPSGRHLCATCAYAAVCRKEYAEEQ